MQIETERLILRQYRDSDLDVIAGLNADPEVMQFFPRVMTREESEGMCERVRNQIEAKGYGFWVAELKEIGECIGLIGILDGRDDMPYGVISEVGWRLARPYWGQGLAPEGAKAAIEFGFNELHLDELVAVTALQNLKSRRVMEKLGMTHDPECDFLHPRVPDDSHVKAHVLYRSRRDN